MSKQFKADLLLLVIAMVWGSSFTLMKNILDDIPPFAFLSLRFAIAAVVLVIIFYKKLKLITPKALMYGFILGTILFGGMALQVNGLKYTTASNSAFITGLSLVMVPLVSAVFLRKKPGMTSVIGVVLAAVGLFFLTGISLGDFNLNKGDLLTLLCAMCFTFHIIFVDRFTTKEDATVLAILQVVFAALMSTAEWGRSGFAAFEFNMPVVGTLLVTGVLGTALAYTGQVMVQKFTSPTHTALIFTAEPVFGAIFALLIPNSQGFTEHLALNTVIGCIMILLGMLVSEFRFTKSKVYID
ncbi:MAG: DMT family transporter [Clostridia bacterium]|nr:DMT family transporter [Clostridia bacterium]